VVYGVRSGTFVRGGYKSRGRASDERDTSRLRRLEPGSVGSTIEKKKRVSKVTLSLARR
jgi:hypothetical protein